MRSFFRKTSKFTRKFENEFFSEAFITQVKTLRAHLNHIACYNTDPTKTSTKIQKYLYPNYLEAVAERKALQQGSKINTKEKKKGTMEAPIKNECSPHSLDMVDAAIEICTMVINNNTQLSLLAYGDKIYNLMRMLDNNTSSYTPVNYNVQTNLLSKCLLNFTTWVNGYKGKFHELLNNKSQNNLIIEKVEPALKAINVALPNSIAYQSKLNKSLNGFFIDNPKLAKKERAFLTLISSVKTATELSPLLEEYQRIATGYLKLIQKIPVILAHPVSPNQLYPKHPNHLITKPTTVGSKYLTKALGFEHNFIKAIKEKFKGQFTIKDNVIIYSEVKAYIEKTRKKAKSIIPGNMAFIKYCDEVVKLLLDYILTTPKLENSNNFRLIRLLVKLFSNHFFIEPTLLNLKTQPEEFNLGKLGLTKQDLTHIDKKSGVKLTQKEGELLTKIKESEYTNEDTELLKTLLNDTLVNEPSITLKAPRQSYQLDEIPAYVLSPTCASGRDYVAAQFMRNVLIWLKDNGIWRSRLNIILPAVTFRITNINQANLNATNQPTALELMQRYSKTYGLQPPSKDLTSFSNSNSSMFGSTSSSEESEGSSEEGSNKKKEKKLNLN